MKFFFVIFLFAMNVYGSANDIVTLSGTLVSYSAKEVSIRTSTGVAMTFPRSYAGDLNGYISGQAKVQLKVPAKELNRQIAQIKSVK
jgi:hypothetical protein